MEYSSYSEADNIEHDLQEEALSHQTYEGGLVTLLFVLVLKVVPLRLNGTIQ